MFSFNIFTRLINIVKVKKIFSFSHHTLLSRASRW